VIREYYIVGVVDIYFENRSTISIYSNPIIVA
jgi:hypothetical protein